MESSTAPNKSPLKRNAQPIPTFAMISPAAAGPIICAALNEVEFKATALDRSPSPHDFRNERLAYGSVEGCSAAG